MPVTDTRDTPAGPARLGPVRQHTVPVSTTATPPSAGDLRPARGAARASVVAAPVVAALILAVVVVLDLTAPSSGPGVALSLGYGWMYAVLGLVVCLLATVVLLQDHRQVWGWLLTGFGLFWSLDALAQSWIRWGVREDWVAPGENLALWFLNRVGSFLPVTVAALLMIYPTGRLLPGWWGRVCAGFLVLGSAASTMFLLLPAPEGSRPADAPAAVDLNAFTPGIGQDLAEPLLAAAVPTLMTSVLVGMASVAVRFRRADEVERDRLRWLLWAVIAMAMLAAVSALVRAQPVQDALLFCLTLLPAAAMTVGVVRPDLVPVQDLVARTLVLGALGVVLVLVDLAVVAGLTAVLGGSLDETQVVVVALLLTVTLYGPLRQRLNLTVRRWALGERAERYDVVAGLATALESADEGADQLAAVAQAVASAFGVGYVEVEVDRGAGERLVASYGERPAATRTLPITYRDAEVGRLVLPARGVRSRLSGRDEQLLADLVRQAATAARTSRLADELQDSRERLVVAREEERRRIRRDLHDGLGPALSGVVFQIESARLLVDRDPAGARGLLTTTVDHVKEVVADVRRLVHDLRPPALDDRGLVGALGQLADTLAVPVDLVADDLARDGAERRLPAAVEVAAYRITAEALTNVVRHSGATRADVRLGLTGDALLVEVSDDGRGIPPEVQAGVGLLSLRERAAELGGRTEITCPEPGGTRVRAWLPLRAVPAQERPQDPERQDRPDRHEGDADA